MNEDTKRQTDMKNAALRAADVLRGLANSDRLLLMCQLSLGEANVAGLEAAVGITQPTLSQQLGVMRRLKLVETRRAGKMVYYWLRWVNTRGETGPWSITINAMVMG